MILADKKLLYEGKAKKVYATDKEDQVIQEFKDDATAFDGGKKGKIKNKGVLNNAISSKLFEFLESYNIPTHFIEKISDKEMLVKKLDIIPVEVVIRNVAAGSLCKRYGVEEGKVLKYPLIEYFLKNDDMHDPLISESFAYALDYATPDEMKHIARLAAKINAVLKAHFERRQLKLIDFKMEFGRYQNQVILGDEISPDTCRFWDMQSNEKLDKDRFRFDMGKVEEAYQEIYNRVIGE
ncbi:MAG: phosphoribosylaminoimidazolesuccinocarboxamide synthase [Calditrichaceae bacterium]